MKKNLFKVYFSLFLAALLAVTVLFSTSQSNTAPEIQTDESQEELMEEIVLPDDAVVSDEKNHPKEQVVTQEKEEKTEQEKVQEVQVPQEKVAVQEEQKPALEEAKPKKAQVASKEVATKKKGKGEKIETRQLIYCTASKKIIPVGQFLLKDGVVSAIIHPSPISRLFFTAKASAGYYLVSANKKSVVKAEIRTTTIGSVGQDGAKVTLLVSDAKAMMFIVEGNGFKPGEKVKIIQSSYHEQLEQELEATSEGQLFTVLAPAVVGKAGGVCNTQIVRESETLQFKFPWGKKAEAKKAEAEAAQG